MAKTIDKVLQTNLKQALGGKPLRFGYIAMGMEGTLLAGKQITSKQTGDAKKALGGGQIYTGRVVGEGGTLFFEVVKEPPASLVAQIKRRIKEDAGLTCPVEIRIKADADKELPEATQEGVAPPSGTPETPENEPQASTSSSDNQDPSPNAAEDQAGPTFKREYARLALLAEECLRDQRGDTAKIRATLMFAKEKGDQEKYPAGLQSLKILAELVEAPPPVASPKEEADSGPKAGTEDNLNVLFTQARLMYDQTRKKLRSELEKVEKAILETCSLENGYDTSVVASRTKDLYAILDVLDTQLLDTLDDALNATDPVQRQRLRNNAADLVDEYLAHVNSDPIMGLIEDNGFASTSIRSLTVRALEGLAARL